MLQCVMYEIELKAHVEDSRAVARTLDSFAEYIGALTKRDTYYRLPHTENGVRKNGRNKNHVYVQAKRIA